MNAHANTTIDKPAPLLDDDRGDDKSAAEKTWQRSIHDVEMVNEVTERLLKMKAVTDLMLSSSVDTLAKDTMNNLGWLLIDMIDEVKAIVCETEEIQA